MRVSRLRKAQSMLEVVAAASVLAITLAPATQIMRRAMIVNAELEQNNALATLGASKLEETMAKTCASWDITSLTGDFSADGVSLARFEVTRSEDASAGGIPGRLMAISVVVWMDTNRDGIRDSQERQVRYATKLARNKSYEYEAQKQ